MGYFTTKLSFNMLVKEFLELVNICQSYGQKYSVLFYSDTQWMLLAGTL